MPKKRSTAKRAVSVVSKTAAEPELTRASQLWGHDRAWALAQRLRREGTFPQAMLIVGPKAVGKATFAKLLARSFFCTHNEHAPCGECGPCAGFGNAASHIVHLNETTETVNIEALRDLQEQSRLKAFDGKQIVLIVTDTDELSEGAWNSVLKFLEEPPAHLIILLTARDEQAIPATVRSRSAILRLHPIAESILSQTLSTSTYGPDERLWAISRCGGLPGRLASLLTTEGATRQRAYEQQAEALAKANSVTQRWQLLQTMAGSTQPNADDTKNILERLEETDHISLHHHALERGTWVAAQRRRQAFRFARRAQRRNSSPTAVLFSIAINA